MRCSWPSQCHVTALLLSAIFFTSTSALSDSGIYIPTREEAARVNDDTIGVVFTHEELFHQLVHNMESELEHDSGLRIVPVMGKNHVQSIYDLLYLKGIDLALVRADAIEYVKRKGKYATIQRIVQNVAKVSEEKIMIIAGKDYQSIDELVGEAVGFGLPGSGEYVTGTIAFETLDIAVEHVELDNITAIERIKSGDLAAMIYLLRAPDAVQTGADLRAADAVKNLTESDALHLLPIPELAELSAIYTPATLTHEDLPVMLPVDGVINTYSVDAILAAYRWPKGTARYRKSRRFINALVDGLEGLQNDVYQPVWKRVDLKQKTPNVAPLPLVERAIADRKAAEARLAAVEKEKLEAKKRAEALARQKLEEQKKAEKLAQLVKKRNELTSRLEKELSEANSVELERMLSELNKFLETSDSTTDQSN